MGQPPSTKIRSPTRTLHSAVPTRPPQVVKTRPRISPRSSVTTVGAGWLPCPWEKKSRSPRPQKLRSLQRSRKSRRRGSGWVLTVEATKARRSSVIPAPDSSSFATVSRGMSNTQPLMPEFVAPNCLKQSDSACFNPC